MAVGPDLITPDPSIMICGSTGLRRPEERITQAGVAGEVDDRAAVYRHYGADLGRVLHCKGSRRNMAKKNTSAHRNPWTKDDLRALKTHSKAKTPVADVAKAMKRTEGAVRQKAKTIGIGLGHRR